MSLPGCRDCGNEYWEVHGSYYVLTIDGEMVETEYRTCGAWLPWEDYSGSGGPLAFRMGVG